MKYMQVNISSLTYEMYAGKYKFPNRCNVCW